MNGKKAKALRRQTVSDPDKDGRWFARVDNQRTILNHPHSFKGQYRAIKRAQKRG
jgi:hypothetical protein